MKNYAPPGNRTRVARMGILHDTITPAARHIRVTAVCLFNVASRFAWLHLCVAFASQTSRTRPRQIVAAVSCSIAKQYKNRYCLPHTSTKTCHLYDQGFIQTPYTGEIESIVAKVLGVCGLCPIGVQGQSPWSEPLVRGSIGLLEDI